MITANLCGNTHAVKNKNNQDYFFKDSKVKVVLDGCSLGDDFEKSNTEVGTKLFASIFSMIPEEKRDDPNMFEENVEGVFKQMLTAINIKRETRSKSEVELALSLFSFTIIACFELEDGFVVKTMGDGYIISKNKSNQISYMKLEYEGNCPPYYIYNCFDGLIEEKGKIAFETYRFSKEHFSNIGVASDGISVLVDGNGLSVDDIFRMDGFLLNLDWLPAPGCNNRIVNIIGRNKVHFYDDVTILF